MISEVENYSIENPWIYSALISITEIVKKALNINQANLRYR